MNNISLSFQCETDDIMVRLDYECRRWGGVVCSYMHYGLVVGTIDASLDSWKWAHNSLALGLVGEASNTANIVGS